jgi:hypothetical protein
MASTITADKVINKSLFSKGNVNVYKLPGGLIIRTIPSGSLVGIVYSWVTYNGDIYWMFNDTYGIPYYVKHDTNLELPDLPAIITQIQDEVIKKKIETLGAFNYYLQSYLPWIIGSVAIDLVVPAFLKNAKK